MRKILADEGISLRDSTLLLKPLLATDGVMTSRKPTKEEIVDIEYGRRVANALAGFDVGQSVAICERACVAVEAMEGTDAMLRRAAASGQRPPPGAGQGGPPPGASAVRRAGSRADTIPVMKETGTTVLAVEAGRTLMLDKEADAEAANAAGIAVVGVGAGRWPTQKQAR